MDLQAVCARAAELQKAGKAEEAERLYLEVLAAAPDYVPALSLLGVLRAGTGRRAEALELTEKAARLGPDSAPALFNHAMLLLELGRAEEALAQFLRVISVQPGNAMAHVRAGQLLQTAGRPAEALSHYDRAVALKPDMASAIGQRAQLNRQLGQDAEALADFDRALALEPGNAAMLAARGYLQWDRFRRLEPALDDLKRAVSLDPRADYLRGDLMHMKMLAGDWQDFEREMAAIDREVPAGKKVVRPFAYQALSGSPADLQRATATYIDNAYPPMLPLWRGPLRLRRKIRVGYVCGHFNKHALAYLAAGLYERHDREKFDIIAFDSGRDDGSAIRARLVNSFDKFLSIATLGDEEAARRVLAEEIDILVNVDGLSGHVRMGLFVRRPAPVQVNWLGYPGTLGASCMDYIIADAIVLPESEQRWYAEKVVTLPHAYQVNDDRRGLAEKPQSRAAHGLPQKGFVFCNFNQSYKLLPGVFRCWMRLLKDVNGSVLWLLEANPLFHANLRREAEAQGVRGDRLIFAPIIAQEEHLARMTLADLFLDTLPYNAHTTCSDALWAGLPVLTCRGTAFPGRVAASLLTAMGLPELIAANMNDYEELALALARDPVHLRGLREKIAANRAKSPLFDTDLYRRHLESAYRIMMEQAGHPRAFRIEGGGPEA
jgi:predicted O-linked N-acetylglucosamine transferase (SPINDLY family)